LCNFIFETASNYLIDIDAGIIVDVAATMAKRGNEIASTRTMMLAERRTSTKFWRSLARDPKFTT